MKNLSQLLIISSLVFCVSSCQMETETTTESESGEGDLSTMEKSSVGMLQHTVYFYLNEDVTEEEKAQFEDGLRELLTIEEIYKSEIGVPGSTADRDVTDHSFGYSIFTWFETMEDYDVYAEHPDHLEFIDRYNHLWADVKVYDSDLIEVME